MLAESESELLIILIIDVINVRTNTAVVSIEAGPSAVTLILVCSKSHTHACILTGVITARIHCK